MKTESLNLLMKGAFLPAMPLVLDENRKFDEAGQRRLVRYYMEAGVDGLAVAVHTTQFAIRNPEINLFETVLRVVKSEMDAYTARTGRHLLAVSGVCGEAPQAVAEAKLAGSIGYDAVLVSPGGLSHKTEAELIHRTQTVAAITSAYRVDCIILLPIINLGTAISTVAAQNTGAGLDVAYAGAGAVVFGSAFGRGIFGLDAVTHEEFAADEGLVLVGEAGSHALFGGVEAFFGFHIGSVAVAVHQAFHHAHAAYRAADHAQTAHAASKTAGKAQHHFFGQIHFVGKGGGNGLCAVVAAQKQLTRLFDLLFAVDHLTRPS